MATTVHFNDREVIDRFGDKVGKVTDVIYDEVETERAEWLVVNPGLFKAEHYVPLEGAELNGEDRLAIPYDAEVVMASPKVEADHAMTSVTRSALEEHYHLADS